MQALGSGITLDSPMIKGHPYGAPVVNHMAATVGYQGSPAPNQWFGGVLSAHAGSIALLDASGTVVVDAMVYGSHQSNSSGNGTIASPELATLGAEQRQGCASWLCPAWPEASGRPPQQPVPPTGAWAASRTAPPPTFPRPVRPTSLTGSAIEDAFGIVFSELGGAR